MLKATRHYTYNIFILLFIILNILNTYFLTTSALNKYIAPFSHTFIGELTAIIGNAGILTLIVMIVSLLFKSLRGRMIALTMITLILNLMIFALGVFNLYYGTAFAVYMLDIFNNPSGGFAGQTAVEAFKELIVYYRIVVLIPFMILTIWTGINFKRAKGLRFTLEYKKVVIQILAICIMAITTSMTFSYQLKEDMPIQSAVSSYAIQNYGVYPYYIQSFLGFETSIDAEEVLEISSDQDALDVLKMYNKNVSSYTNYFNGQTYSNRLTTNQADVDYIDPSIKNGTSLHGILKDKNIVLVHLESFNYFLLQNPYTRDNMSFLVNLLSQSYTFNNFYNNVGMGVSSDAEFSVLTGLNVQGDRTLYWDFEDIDYDLPSIVKYLGIEGYDRTAVHGDYGAFYNRDNVYPNMYGFDMNYTLENFIEDGYDTSVGYLYDEENDLRHESPWVSDYYLADFISSEGQTADEPFMYYPITMMGHTPFDYGPDGNSPDIYENYAPYIHDITLKYLNYANYYSETIKRYFVGDGGIDQTIDDTVYIFYSDHGSGLKNGDLDVLFDREISDLEERQILQQTLAFIYVPSNESYIDFGDYQIRKGLLRGEQDLVRSEVDLYRTIIELFDLPVGDDAYYGVNGLSTEPTFALDNRIMDVVTDDAFFSLRNPQLTFPVQEALDISYIEYLKKYKIFSDYLLSSNDKVKTLNDVLNE